jgi:tetratricopeptide (TPR) repeat protein/TolB-like protein
MVGQTFGHFRILSKLGEGGMGAVWKAEDTYLGRLVALKLLPDELADSLDARRRFLLEARATSQLDHPGIATLYDAGEDDGRLWLAVRLIVGTKLSDRVRGGISPGQAERIALEVADALAHAHERGVLHRDVTPNNIMIDQRESAVLIDFGLARLLKTTTATTSGRTMGTLAYLAPEILRGGRASELSDLYGLGAVCYEMIAGHVPFHAERVEGMLHAAMHQRPAQLSAVCPSVDARFEKLVLACLEKDPRDRPVSAAHVAAALREIVESSRDQGPTRAVTPPPDATRRTRRRTAVAILPFRARSEAADLIALAGGLAESLAAALGRHPEIRVLWEPGAIDDAQGIEDALRRGARRAVVGTVQRSQEKIRVAFSVLDLKRRVRVSGSLIDGSMEDPFALEDELVRAVAHALAIGPGVRGSGQGALEGARAHQLYLQALGHLQRTDNQASVDGAISLLEQVVEKEGGTAVVQATLGRAYLRKLELTLETRWHRKAETACRAALELDPHAPEVRLTLGRLELQSGRHEEAIATLRSAIDLSPDNAEAWHTLSLAYEAAGQFEEAMHAAEERARLRPDSWKSWDQIALLHYRTGAFANAVEAWKRAVEQAPDNALLLASLGGGLMRLERIEEARAAYERSVRAMPLGIAYIGLGVADFLSGDPATALGSFERAVAMMPNDPRTWGNLADTQRWVPGREHDSTVSFERAIQLIRAQLSVNPNDVRNLSYLGLWLAKIGRLEEAQQTVQRALEISPRHLDAHVRAISVFAIAGNLDQAADHLRIALEQGCGLLELERDPELDALRRHPRVASALQELRQPARPPERRSA